MRPPRRQTQLLLLLLPAIGLVAAADAKADVVARYPAPSSAELPKPDLVSASKSKLEIGTKDAPVDGKDGKPHAGPFVDPYKKGDKTELGEKKIERPALKDAPADKTMYKGEKIPETNDGVMDDPNREAPKKGTTGTSGGVSEKDKARKAKEGQTGEKAENVPETPKEAPPLPHSEHEKILLDKETGKTPKKPVKDDQLGGLGKPTNLPEKLTDGPNPIPESARKDHLDIPKAGGSGLSGDADESIIQPFHSFVLSLTMILVSEIGDKTFLIAALMAMKHDRMVVFTAAFGALFVMTVLSAVVGHAVPALLPKRFTSFLAAGLFLIFGVRLLREGLAMSADEGVAAEMQEVEMELQEKEHQALKDGRRRSSATPYAMEMGLGRSRKSRSQSRLATPPRSPSMSPARSPSPRGGLIGNLGNGLSNLFSLLLSPAWVQTFVMTFLGEWGDRSQIATIAMAAGQDYWWVILGALVGHSICTGVAVLGGRAIAGRVSMKVVTVGGAIAFLIFAVIYFFEAFYA